MNSCYYLILLISVFLLVSCRETLYDGQNDTGSPEAIQPAELQEKGAEPTKDQLDDPEIADLMEKLKSNSTSEVSKAFHVLVGKQSYAIPALQKGLSDKELRYKCVDILTTISSVDSTQVLLDALKDVPETTDKDCMFKCYIIGGLGRLKDDYAVPVLERLYERQKNKERGIATSVAWALKQITGEDYGPAYDPWEDGITIVRPRSDQSDLPWEKVGERRD